MRGFKFKPLFNFSKWISAPIFCDPICNTLKQLQNTLQKLPVSEKDTKKTPTHPSHSRQQGHLSWDYFYDLSEIRTFSLLLYKVVILLHMHVCYLNSGQINV